MGKLRRSGKIYSVEAGRGGGNENFGWLFGSTAVLQGNAPSLLWASLTSLDYRAWLTIDATTRQMVLFNGGREGLNNSRFFTTKRRDDVDHFLNLGLSLQCVVQGCFAVPAVSALPTTDCTPPLGRTLAS